MLIMGSSVASDSNCSVGNESPARMREPQLVFVLFHWNRGERGTGSKASGILPLLQALFVVWDFKVFYRHKAKRLYEICCTDCEVGVGNALFLLEMRG